MATLREVKKRIKTVKSTNRITNAMEMVAVCCVLILVAASSSSGFDGNRKGFVLGGGLGLSTYSSWSAKGTFGAAQIFERLQESGAGLGMNFIIGHAWDEQNMIVFEINGVGRSSEELANNPTIWQGIHGTVWYHYYGMTGRSFFSAIGLVLYRFAYWTTEYLSQKIGPGFILGVGYEFARHWQISGYWGSGYSLESSEDWYFKHLNILVSFVAF